MPDYIIYTSSDPVANELFDSLQEKGFSVFGRDMKESAATLFVSSTSRSKLKKAIKTLYLTGPYKIEIAKVERPEFFTGLKDMTGHITAADAISLKI